MDFVNSDHQNDSVSQMRESFMNDNNDFRNSTSKALREHLNSTLDDPASHDVDLEV